MELEHDLMPPELYSAYRRHAKANGYCEPWLPYVGPTYSAPAPMPRFVFCGGAAWWDSEHQFPSADEAAAAKAGMLTSKFITEGMYSTPFWRVYWRVCQVLPGARDLSQAEIDKRVCWTNLTKTGRVQQTAPPDNDVRLRELDLLQVRYELSALEPDIILCVSGSIVPSTGHGLFDDWDKCLDLPDPGHLPRGFGEAPRGPF